MRFRKQCLPGGLLIAMFTATPAAAVEKFMEMSANAAANCQGALPIFEGTIRKRPLAVENDGTTASFVTCPFVNQYDSDAPGGIDYIDAYFTNKDTSAAVVSCVAVAGFETGADNKYVSKEITVAANSTVHALMHFDASDNDGESFYPLVSLSCRLPPKVGNNDTYVGYIFNDE